MLRDFWKLDRVQQSFTSVAQLTAYLSNNDLLEYTEIQPIRLNGKTTRNLSRNFKKKTEPLVMKFQIGWEGRDKTPEHIAYVSDFHAYGKWSIAELEFVAIDPANWRSIRWNSGC